MNLNDIKITDVLQGEQFQKFADNKRIYYCHTHEVNDFFDNINFTHDFVLISHNSDGKITDNPCKTAAGHLLSNGKSPDADIRKIPSNLKKWYAQNVTYKSSVIVPIPIGLENYYNFPHLHKIKKLFSIRNTNKNLQNLIYLNCNIDNNPKERQMVYDILKDKKYTTVVYGKNGFGFDNFLYNLYNHCFMVCIPGNGPDVHSFWECLYVGTIPIQKKSIYNSNWRDLPVCWLDNWEQLNDEEFLKIEYNRITSQKFDLSKLTFKYWKDLINKEI